MTSVTVGTIRTAGMDGAEFQKNKKKDKEKLCFCKRCLPRVMETVKKAKLLREATTEKRKDKDSMER